MKHDRDAAQAGREAPRRSSRASCAASSGAHDLAVGADALVDLDHRAYSSSGSTMWRIEQARPVLVADAQRVAEAARRHQQRRLALALEQRVGRDRRAHLHALDLRRAGSARRRRGRAGAGCRRPPRRGTARGSRTAACGSTSVPSGRRPTMSVKVPPRSIQNCHRRDGWNAGSRDAARSSARVVAAFMTVSRKAARDGSPAVS